VIAGHVYVVHTTLTRPPKDKITVCVCATDNLFFWLNTEPRGHGVGQLPLRSGDHAALSRDCFLDCSRITTFLPPELAAAKDRGQISGALARRIVEFLSENPPHTLSPRHINVAITSLSALF
jgi:hypothetical protein